MGSPVKKSMLFVLLDESGSMSGMNTDVIGSINKFIEDQRKLPDPAVIAIGVFTSQYPERVRFIRTMSDLKEVRLLSNEDYSPCGGTPLLDATGQSIQALDVDWAREKPDRCVFVTFTDGQENASTEFNRTKIKQMVQAREKSGLWNFLFLGTNIDSFLEGGTMGYTSNKMSNYVNTSVGTRSAIHKMSETVGTMRSFSNADFAAVGASADIGLGGNIAEDGSVSKGTDGAQKGFVDVTLGTIPGGYGNSPNPPLASMKPEDWTAQQSSALYDPKLDAWKPPA